MRNIGLFQTNDRGLAVLLCFSLLATYSLFLQWSSANITSRIAVTLSIVQDGTLSIDRFQGFTIDKAYFRGHFYSDKAPGLALMSVPIVYTTRIASEILLSRDEPVIAQGQLTPFFTLYIYIATVLTSGLLTAAAASALFLTARGLGATPGAAILGALSYGVASPAFGWATAFFGHAAAGASLFLAFAALVALQHRSPSPGRVLPLACCAGGFLGMAIVVDFTTLPAAAVLAVFALRIAVGLPHQRWRVLSAGSISLVVMLIPLGLYNYSAFGSPWHIGYENVVGFVEMKQGFMGIGVPRLHVIEQILFGRYRGLFTVSPVLLLAVWSTVDTWWRGVLGSGYFICIVAIVVSFLLINSGYYYWDGGWSFGPRFLTPMIPFLCLPLAIEWSSARPLLRGILSITFIASVVISFAATSVGITVPVEYNSPLTQFIAPRFLRGDLSSSVTLAARWPAWTVMIPLILIWVLSSIVGKLLLRGGPILVGGPDESARTGRRGMGG
jgi:hypothetical protein